ncbi:MAG: CYTH domain-containing protein [Candidatus Altiarchaeota archaeon]|nr:CYTH domain-containing protein [Candidatus Altiarchaeota archaeon]
MKEELEVKILDIDSSTIFSVLEKAGATKVRERLMKRYVYDIPGKQYSWVRLRDDGRKVTLAVKEAVDETGKTFEIESEITDIQGINKIFQKLNLEIMDYDKKLGADPFEGMNLVLQKSGYEPRAYQENARISYQLDSVELELDFWPGIPPYLEIEAQSEQEIEETVAKLGFEMSQTIRENTAIIYKKYYGINIYDYKKLTREHL